MALLIVLKPFHGSSVVLQNVARISAADISV